MALEILLINFQDCLGHQYLLPSRTFEKIESELMLNLPQ